MSALVDIKNRLKDHEDEVGELQEMDLSEIKIGRFTPEITKELDAFKNVKVIILQGCELQSLEHLPKWDLYVLDLSENKLTDSAIPALTGFKNLNQLICPQNQFATIQSLQPLTALENLSEVDFSENPVAGSSNYRTWLFENIPSLEIVDSTDKEGNAVEEEQEFEEGSDDEEDFDGEEDEQDYEQESESLSSEKPKKKKK